MAELENMRHLLEAFGFVSDADWQLFSSKFHRFQCERKELISHENETEKYLYFVCEGVQRVYYFDGQREATLVLTYAPSFGGIIDSFMLQSKSKYKYESLTKSTFYRISHSDFKAALNQSETLQQLLMNGLAGVVSGLLERMLELQCFSSEDKFKSLMHRSPQVLHLVPHKYLANYLGIDASNFSKFINRFKI